MNCADMKDALSDFNESGLIGLTVIQDHLTSCPDCRAELARFDELQAALGSLPDHSLEPPSWLEGSITETIQQKAARIAALRQLERQVRRPGVVTGGALMAAGIAGALLFRSKRRRRVGWARNVRQALAHAS